MAQPPRRPILQLVPLDSRINQLILIKTLMYIQSIRHCRDFPLLGGQQKLPLMVVLPLLGDRPAPLFHQRGALQRWYCWGKAVPQHSK